MKMRSRALWLLALIAMVNLCDGAALSIVLQNVKVDMRLTDGQLGMIAGLGVAVIATLTSLPLGVWADRGDRVQVICISTLVAGVANMLCGLAQSFSHMLSLRALTSLGDVASGAPTKSLLADLFNEAEMPRAFGIYFLGASASHIVGLWLGGMISQAYGWRTMMVALGFPGVLLALFGWRTLRDPRQLVPRGLAQQAGPRMAATLIDGFASLKPALLDLWKPAALRFLVIGNVLFLLLQNGAMIWGPVFFARNYNLEPAELGTWLAIVLGGTSLLGVYIGGELASRFTTGGMQLRLFGVAGAYAFSTALHFAAYAVHSKFIALGLWAVGTFAVALTAAPLTATLVALVPVQTRATVISLFTMVLNVAAFGLSPVILGLLSDYLTASMGEEGLRYSILAACPLGLMGAVYVALAGTAVARKARATADV